MGKPTIGRWFLAPARRGAPVPPAADGLNLALAAVALVGLFAFAFSRSIYAWDWASVWNYRGALIRGWWTTLWISAAALVASTLLGLAVALFRKARLLVLRQVAGLYVELVRGTPLLVQILVFYYVVAYAFGADNRYVMGVVVLSLFAGAYIGEIIRAGIDGVGETQIESGRAVGFTPAQIFRHVVFPQALRRVLPPLAGQFVSLVKDSSLLQVIALTELTFSAQQTAANTFSKLEAYLLLVPGYLLLTLPISLWTRHLERKLHYEA
jgi:polar amino acid transport system permease protein